MEFKREFKESPIKSAGVLIGMVVGIITIITALSAAIGVFDDYFVSPDELKIQLVQSENRVTAQYRKEALIIRNSLLSDLNSQVSALENLLDDDDTSSGEIALYTIRLRGLTDRIKVLRGEK